MLPPVVWKPTTKFGFPYMGTLGRGGQWVRAFVRHRIVGSLASADAVFDSASARMASTHFGIGHINGRLEIHQYVDLSDAAWGNGDVRDPTASVVFQNPGVNPNLYTVSIEHEDGGEAGRGVVQSDTWAASIDLALLLVSENAAAIRAAGITVRADATVAQMAAVPKNTDGYIDHNQIAGPNKPYCFRRWLDDLGYVEGSPSRRDQLLAALNGGSVGGSLDMKITTKIYPWPRNWSAKGGVLTGYVMSDDPNIDEDFAAGSSAQSSAEVVLDPLPTTWGWPTGPYQLVSSGPLKGYLIANSLVNLGLEPIAVAAPPVVSGITQAQLDTAILNATAAGRAAGIKAAQDDLVGLT